MGGSVTTTDRRMQKVYSNRARVRSATASGIDRLIFVKGTDDSRRQPKMQTLLNREC